MQKNIFLGLFLLLGLVLPLILYPTFMGDDTFIHLCFAKSLAEKGIWSYNGNITNGSTAPLWTIFAAFISKINLFSIETEIRFLSLISGQLSIFLLWKTSLRYFSPLISGVIVCFWIVNSYFLRWTATGMESVLAATLLLYIYATFDTVKAQLKPKILLIWGFSCLIRPEFYLFIFISFIFLFFDIELNKKNIQNLLISALIVAIPVFLWNGYAYFQFGTIIPNTFYHKAGNGLFAFEFTGLSRSLMTLVSNQLIELAAFAVCGGLLLFNRKWALLDRNILLPIAWLLAFYVYYILKDVLIVSRYALVFTPVILVALFRLMQKMETLFPLNFQAFLSKSPFFLLALQIAFHASITLLFIQPEAKSFANGFQSEYKKIAYLLKMRNAKSVALSDVGIIGLYSDAQINDLVGLTDHRRFSFKDKKEYVKYVKPQYILCREDFNLAEIVAENQKYKLIYEAEIASMGLRSEGKRKVKLWLME